MGDLPTNGLMAETSNTTNGLTRDQRNDLREDLIGVLVAHGLIGGSESVTMNVSNIMQGGEFAGVAISGMAYQRPEQLPPASECTRTDGDPLVAAIKRAEVASAPAWTREQYDAWIKSEVDLDEIADAVAVRAEAPA
ncbi:hypothetical protein BZB76_1851 [Actinomadura pelletieri DSM 43383]|uniref:Uncharacterized protein n=1 Tax=Actinomadura pelletieri DSM 43383 TaxID=1120940 RepID=A0A495QSL2_9ACTN|nr:hypothetical protein [Actinomadura pelletieri]RKS76495.1 hypothetical protein BZB76_1851 [Actinomadura pelletieri DSM 43383]